MLYYASEPLGVYCYQKVHSFLEAEPCQYVVLQSLVWISQTTSVSDQIGDTPCRKLKDQEFLQRASTSYASLTVGSGLSGKFQ